MELHTISSTKKKKARRVGRGGKRGTFSGRGTKGQKARSGRRIRPQLRDALKKIPKRRGYRFRVFRIQPISINLKVLEQNFVSGDTITPTVLLEKKVITKQGGRIPAVKILGSGDITKNISVQECAVSASAKEKIQKAGGSITNKK